MENYKMNLKIIFAGTPEFGAVILEKLIKSGYRPALVITSPDRKVGRRQILKPPPVKIIAQKHKIAVEQPERINGFRFGLTGTDQTKLNLQKLKPDLGVVASFGQIISREILNIPKHGFINVHPSLLPKYRGPSPVQTAILKGEKETGATIIKITEKVDAGPILASLKFKITNPEITYQELHGQLAELGADLLVKTVPDLIQGRIRPKQQDESKATYTKILKKEDGKMDWQKSAQVLEREIRAFYPWPGSFIIWENKDKPIKIKVLKSRILKSSGKRKHPLGKVLLFSRSQICIQCEKDLLILEKIHPEGKREMLSEDFLRGRQDFVGAILKQKQ